MTVAVVPQGYAAELEYCGEKIQKLLKIYNYNSLTEIARVLVEKSINLNPNDLEKLFGKTFSGWSTRDKFNVLKRVMTDLRMQGIYIPFIGDKFTMDKGRGVIVKSSYHPEGPLPVTEHNRLVHLRWVVGEDNLVESVKRVQKEKERAKEIHSTFSHRLGWTPWADSPIALTGYQALAYEMAVEEIGKEDMARYRKEIDHTLGVGRE